MRVRKFSPGDATLVKSPGQGADIFVGNLVDQDDGAPITIGYGRYGPGQRLSETIRVDDVMIVLEGNLSVTSGDETMAAGPGDIVHMPKGQLVTIVSGDLGALTAYVTYPHWQEARD